MNQRAHTTTAMATGTAPGAPAPAARRGILKDSCPGLTLPEIRGRGQSTVSVVDRFFAEEICRIDGDQAAGAWLLQNQSRHMSDTASMASCDSYASSAQSAVSTDSAASSANTERAGGRPVMLMAKNGRMLCFGSDVAGKERSSAAHGSATAAGLHPMLRSVLFGKGADSGAPLAGRRNSSPSRLGFGEGARRPPSCYQLKHTGSLDAILSNFVEEEREPEPREQLVAALAGAKNVSSEESASEEESEIDRAGLLYTDAAHLVIE